MLTVVGRQKPELYIPSSQTLRPDPGGEEAAHCRACAVRGVWRRRYVDPAAPWRACTGRPAPAGWQRADGCPRCPVFLGAAPWRPAIGLVCREAFSMRRTLSASQNIVASASDAQCRAKSRSGRVEHMYTRKVRWPGPSGPEWHPSQPGATLPFPLRATRGLRKEPSCIRSPPWRPAFAWCSSSEFCMRYIS